MGSGTKAISLALLLAGCGAHQAPVEPNEYQIALKQVKDEWLKDCEGLGDRPGNATGDLLQDFADAAALGGECRARHNSAVQYLRPLVEKAKSSP